MGLSTAQSVRLLKHLEMSPVPGQGCPRQAVRRASRYLLDGHSVQADHFLWFGDWTRGVALTALTHGVVAPGVHFIVYTVV